jgi:mono/diheme cytochrome c family protein
MKRLVTTSALCFLFGVLLFAQGKKQPAASASIKRGQQVYQMTCIACHQKDGGGVPRLNPPLIKTTYVLGDKSQLINIVLKGLSKPIEIEGEEYNNTMPSQAQLTDQQIADVLTYVRNSFGNKAAAITPAQVKAERAKAQ